ncbi:MAG: glutamate--tRNA ligase [Patescibacteria group bacterium]
MSVRVRFAPSPTGEPHVGVLRTALFNWLFARKEGGQFILRIEDTDRERYQEKSVGSIMEALTWLGLAWDEGPIYQSKRREIYKKMALRLVREKKAYYCFCSKDRLEKLRIEQAEKKMAPRYDKCCLKLNQGEIDKNLKEGMPYVIRQNIPESGVTEFKDIIRGIVSFENNNLDDSVLLKSDGYPTYHLAVVVDDHEMGITHVIRAEEWLPSTPKHILLYQAFGFPPPAFAHLPMILGHDKKKLSKRHGATSVLQYIKDGYLPEAMLNFLAFLGWNPKTEKEFFSREELIKEFSLENINKAGAVFNLDKLLWLNGLYIRNLSLERLIKAGQPYLRPEYQARATEKNINLEKVWRMAQERINTLKQINSLCDFVFEEIDYLPEILIPIKSNKNETVGNLKLAQKQLENVKEAELKASDWRQIFEKYIQENDLKTGKVLWPLRVALSGKRASPDVFDILEIFGRQKSLDKVKKALIKLENL